MSKSETAYRKIQAAFDEHVSGLSPEEYRDVIDKVIGHVKSCEDCLREEDPDLFK